MKAKILVASHNKVSLPNKEGYIPNLVGAKRNYKPDISYQRYHQGKNISDKNPNYIQFTAIYLAWKNLKDADA
ncbi:DUF4422 domain-containing protein, partial [Lactobacillus jensenii]|uniref:DUF4422 domain-containing protein n=1 Tax=Lactobacillus jensenii TaxID=109790 RepID=UPI00287064B7